MGDIRFGMAQINRPTPQRISVLFDFLAGAAGVISGFVTSAAFISHNVSDILSSVLSSLVIPLLLLAKRAFGNGADYGKKVPIEDVVEIKDK